MPDDIATRVNLAIAIPKRLTEKQPVRELIAPMETVLGNLAGISEVVGLRHIVWEIATSDEAIVFYVNVPMEIAEFVEKQITSQYPDAT